MIVPQKAHSGVQRWRNEPKAHASRTLIPVHATQRRPLEDPKKDARKPLEGSWKEKVEMPADLQALIGQVIQSLG